MGQTYYAPQNAAQKAGNFNTTGGGTYNLQATITSSQTTIQLSSFMEPISNIPYTMSYLNSSIEYATIAPQTSQSEFISFTGITQNSDGSATLTGVQRGLDRSYPYTASTTLALPHAGQTRLILSNPPQVYNSYAALTNANTFSAVNTFGSTTPPTYDADPIWANFSTQILADVSYVNSVVAAGAANASETVKGIGQLATAAQAALGTSLGSTGARLILGNNLATSTPGVQVTNVIPVTGTNEKLSQAFLDLTQGFTTSGAWIFNAMATLNGGLLSTGSSTLVGTTTIGASSVLNNAVRFNSIPYSFPSIQGVAGTALIDNGSGVLSWGAGANSQYTYASTTASAVAVNSNLTSPFVTIPSGVLTASSTISVQGEVACTGTGSGGTCSVSVVDNSGNTYISQSWNAPTNSTNVVPFTININAKSSISSQSEIFNGYILSGTDLFVTNTSAVSWSGAVGFGLKLATSAVSGQSGAINGFTLTVRP